MNQDSDVLQRDILARFQAVNPNLTWKEAKEQFANEDKYWVTVYDGFDQYIDYQFNSNISSSLNLVTGLDFELKDPFTNRTGIKENGYDNFLREEVTTDTDVTEYRYGIYAQLQSNIFDSYELTGSLRYDNHEYYGDMISPKFALVNDSFLNGSLKIIAGRGFKAPTLVDRNIYNGIVDAFAGTAPWNWTIQGKAIGNKDGFTIYDFYDVGNGLRDENEPFIDSNYGFVGSGNTYETQNECVSSGGTYDSQYNSCGNGSYDLGELYWELDGNGFYGPEDILIDSSYVRPLEIEKFTSFEVAYLGALSKSTLIDLNTYFGVYENFKSPLRPQGISGPFFFNDGEAFGSIKQINQGNEILGGHPITDTNEYIYLLTYESMPIKINYYGLELGIKHYSKKYEIAANFSYFNDSDLVNKRDKAEKYYMYLEDPDANSQWSIFSEYQNFYKVYSNTSNLKYNASITLIEPIINNFDISLNLKGVKPFDFVSGYFQATEKYKGQLYNPVEGFKVDEGRVGGGIYMDLNLVYRLDHVSFGASIKNILETKTISFPMTPYLPRSFVVQLGYEF